MYQADDEVNVHSQKKQMARTVDSSTDKCGVCYMTEFIYFTFIWVEKVMFVPWDFLTCRGIFGNLLLRVLSFGMFKC